MHSSAKIAVSTVAVVLNLFLVGTAQAETVISLGPTDDVATRLAAAKPGTVVELAPGDYGNLVLKKVSGAEGQPLTLRSKDPAHPARLSRMDLREVNHLVLDDLLFDYTFSSDDPGNIRPFQVFTTRDLTIRNSEFDGDIATLGTYEDSGYPTGIGLAVRASAQILLENNEIHDFYRGLVINDVVDAVIQRNDLHAIRMDGMNFAQVERVRIEENQIHDFKRAVDSADHADMIQFWTKNTERPTRDIIIRNNLLNSGGGAFTQSIFMRNEAVDADGRGQAMFYRNIVIEGNAIINAQAHGITVGETDGLEIRNNTLIHNAHSDGALHKPKLWRPRIMVAGGSTHVTVTRNAAADFILKGTGWTVSDNLVIQDLYRARPGFYDQVFVAARTGDPRNLANFVYLPEGPLGSGQIGSPLLARAQVLKQVQPMQGEPAVQPAIRIAADPEDPMQLTFSAENSLLPQNLTPSMLKYDWTIDGTVHASGETVTHLFEKPGKYDVLLAITLPDNTLAKSQNSFVVKNREILTFDGETGLFTSFAEDTPRTVDPDQTTTGPLTLGKGGGATDIGPDLIAPFFSSQGFELELRVRSDKGYKGAGELLLIHQTLWVTITQRGILDIRLLTASGHQAQFRTAPVQIFNGKWVDLRLRYSSQEQRIDVFADDRLIGSSRVSGPISKIGYWGLSLGNPVGVRPSFQGELGYLSLRFPSN